MAWLIIVVLSILTGTAWASPGAQDLKATATLAKPAIGENNLIIHLARGGAPVTDAKITLTVAMTSMDMGMAHPPVTNRGGGNYAATVKFTMNGPWRVTAKIEAGETVTQSFDFHVGEDATMGMAMDGMQGRLGSWGMQREASGTSWVPDSSPMFMKALPKSGPFDLRAMGFLTFNYSDAGGKRGDTRFYSNSMLMLMGRRDTGSGVFGFSVMASLDPVFNGEFGYPNLFQTGETAYGQPLVDYQHPHDLLAEATVSYSRPISHDLRGFVYGGPVGEPSLGGPTFMHRPSGMEIPEAPISHHWFDSTHISWGVLTAGVNSEKWQLEGSLFNGHEPNEDRYAPDPISLNSAAGRITFAPNRNVTLNASYGYLHSPESKEPGVDQHRLTAAAIWSLPLRGSDNLSMTAAFGRNIIQGERSDAFLLEATWLTGPTSVFARWENVDKNELVGVPAGTYKVNKFLVGAVRDVAHRDGFELGIGGYLGLYAFPDSLDPYYGKSPVTLGVFLRIRPERMTHDMAGMRSHH